MASHATLSASGSKRWMACLPSAKLESLFPEVASAYAEEGTRAHKIAEQELLARLEGPGELVLTEPDDLRIQQEVRPYVEHVMSLYDRLQKEEGDAVLFLETCVNFENYVPGGFGTADTIIMAGNTLYLIDLKFGAGVAVDAEDNSQLQLYALGAINEFGEIYDLESVTMQICQPRIMTGRTFSEQTKTVPELIEWGTQKVLPRATKAFAGEGAYVAGEHCRFCKAKAVCRARKEHFTKITALQQFKPEELTDNGSLALILREKKQIETWLKDIESYALDQMQKGVSFDGLKLVAGRATTDLAKPEEELVEKLLANGVQEALLYKPRQLVSRTELKKLMDKDAWETIEKEFYTKNQGKPKIDKAESKAKEWRPKNDFENLDLAAFEEE